MVFISLISESAFLNKDSEIVKLIYADSLVEVNSSNYKLGRNTNTASTISSVAAGVVFPT